MFDAIDRKALLEQCKDPEFMVRNEYTEGYKTAMKVARHFISTAPALDVTKAVPSRWILATDRDSSYAVFCDECCYKLPNSFVIRNSILPKHCPECGAKMDLKEVDHENA